MHRLAFGGLFMLPTSLLSATDSDTISHYTITHHPRHHHSHIVTTSTASSPVGHVVNGSMVRTVSAVTLVVVSNSVDYNDPPPSLARR